MTFPIIIQGIIIGFSLAAPVGPIGILCIRRTLAHGFWRGMLVGLGGALADIVYAFAGAFSTSLIFTFIAGHQYGIRVGGGVLLIAVGLYTFGSHPESSAASNRTNGETRILLSTFFLALTNPMTLFAFAAAFTSIGLQQVPQDPLSALLLVVGVFIGSLSWFSLLTGFSLIFREKISTRGLAIVSKIAGTLLVLIGVAGIIIGLIG